MNTILSLGLIFLFALLAAKLIHLVRLPMVTAYLIMGILIGPQVGNLINPRILEASGLFSEFVLGVIAFVIGENFSLGQFRRLGKSVLWISVGEVLVSWGLVSLSLRLLLGQPLYLCLLFGAIAPATAPAATIMVIREYKSKGILTDTLLGVVAVDDAWGLILFAISLAMAKELYYVTHLHPLKVVGFALLKVLGSFIIGGVLGWIFTISSRFARHREETLIYTLGFILLGVGLSKLADASVLLTNMFFGATVVNLHPRGRRFFDLIKDVDFPLYLLFFVLAGASLELGALKQLSLVGLAYFFTRPLGEWLGAWLGASVAKSVKVVKRYLGFGLIPQAGVALGMAVYVKAAFPEAGAVILSVIIGTTVLYEIVGPIFTKFALQRAGEIRRP
jgi:NhaP-type Na+/H+ or K+/H+ antiporter